MNKPKILIALSRFPYPVVDGTRYKILHNVCEALKKDFDLEFFVVTWNSVSQADIEYVEKHYGKVHLWKITKLSFVLRSVQSLWLDTPSESAGFFVAGAYEWVKNNAHAYAAVYAHTIRMTEYFRRLDSSLRSRVLVEFNDAISLNYSEAKKNAMIPANIVYGIESWRVRKYEKKLLSIFSYFNVISVPDREYLKMLNPRSVSVVFEAIPHGSELPDVAQLNPSSHSFYFIGQLDYAPNRDALCVLLEKVWPDVRKRLPNAELFVIGRKSSRAYRRYEGAPGVTFTGFVRDPYDVIKECVLLIAPIRFGAGMPSKIVEAMTYGVPVITTPLGARGIQGLGDGSGLIVCEENNYKEWAELIVEAAQNSATSQAAGRASRSFAEKHFAIGNVQNQWNDLFKKIAHRKKNP